MACIWGDSKFERLGVVRKDQVWDWEDATMTAKYLKKGGRVEILGESDVEAGEKTIGTFAHKALQQVFALLEKSFLTDGETSLQECLSTTLESKFKSCMALDSDIRDRVLKEIEDETDWTRSSMKLPK